MKSIKSTTIFVFVLLCLGCKDSGDNQPNKEAFHIAYDLSKDLNQWTFVAADIDNNILAATLREGGDDASSDLSIILWQIDKEGKVLWSNKIKSQTESSISPRGLISLGNGEFLLRGEIGRTTGSSHRPFLARLDDSGNVLSSNKYEGVVANYSFAYITDCKPGKSNNIICSGYTHENYSTYSIIVFEMSQGGSINWAKKINQPSTQIKVETTEDFILVGSANQDGSLGFHKLSSAGDLITSKKYHYDLNFESIEKVVSSGNQTYMAAETFGLVHLLKLGMDGQFQKGIRIGNYPSFSDFEAYKGDLLLMIDLGGSPELIQFDSDLVVKRQSIVAKLHGVSSLEGELALSNTHIAWALQPIGDEPTVGRHGIVVIKFDNTHWVTRCAVGGDSQYFDSPFALQEEEPILTIEDYALFSEGFELTTEQFVINTTAICK